MKWDPKRKLLSSKVQMVGASKNLRVMTSKTIKAVKGRTI